MATIPLRYAIGESKIAIGHKTFIQIGNGLVAEAFHLKPIDSN